jgi:hypothetical protein
MSFSSYGQKRFFLYNFADIILAYSISRPLYQFLAPEIVKMGQFLGPETDTVGQLLVTIVFSRILANRKRKKQFEHALDYVQ